MMDPMWYLAYIPVFLIGVMAGYKTGVMQSRAAKNKKSCINPRANNNQ
tara:strand:+ start:827 stop:970 length:144 start_codon:yes stop_codon:yes gene_type:complete